MRTVAYFLSLILVFSIPWENSITFEGLGTLTRALGLIMAVAWLVSVLSTGRLRKLHPIHVMVYLFIIWNIASIFWSGGISVTMQNIKTYVQLAIMIWIFWDLYTEPKSLSAALQAYVLGAYIAISSTIFNYLSSQEAYIYSGGRYTGAGLNAVDLALILALGLPMAWHLATSQVNDLKDRIFCFVNYAYIPAALFAITLTGSRMAIFAVVPAVIYILATFNNIKLGLRVLIFVTLIGSLFILQRYVPQSAVDRFVTIGASIADGDIGGRMLLWSASLESFYRHPILGIGSGSLNTAEELGTVAHNTFLSVLTEIGIVGFFLFIAILAIVIHQVYHQPKGYSSLWFTILIIWVIGVSTLTWEYRKPTWLIFIMVIISASLFRQQEMDEEVRGNHSSGARSQMVKNTGKILSPHHHSQVATLTGFEHDEEH